MSVFPVAPHLWTLGLSVFSEATQAKMPDFCPFFTEAFGGIFGGPITLRKIPICAGDVN